MEVLVIPKKVNWSVVWQSVIGWRDCYSY